MGLLRKAKSLLVCAALAPFVELERRERTRQLDKRLNRIKQRSQRTSAS
jgi:hypothetical protein